MRKKSDLTASITFRLDPDIKNKAELKLADENKELSEFLRDCIEKYLKGELKAE